MCGLQGRGSPAKASRSRIQGGGKATSSLMENMGRTDSTNKPAPGSHLAANSAKTSVLSPGTPQKARVRLRLCPPLLLEAPHGLQGRPGESWQKHSGNLCERFCCPLRLGKGTLGEETAS